MRDALGRDCRCGTQGSRLPLRHAGVATSVRDARVRTSRRRYDTVSARPVLTSDSRPPFLSPPAWPGVTLRRGPRSRPASSSAPVSATLRAHGKAWSHERWALWIARRPAAGPHLLAAVSAD